MGCSRHLRTNQFIFIDTKSISRNVSTDDKLSGFNKKSFEARNKELESEISKVQTSQDGIKRELEKYLRLCQEEMERRKLLENKLTDFHRMKERQAELSTELLEKQMNRLLLNKKKSTPRENLDSATSRPCTSTYCRNADATFYQYIHASPSQAAFGSPAFQIWSPGVTMGSGFLQDTASSPGRPLLQMWQEQ